MGLLTAITVLVAVGLLFVLDPGGVIAESGLPEFRQMDWKQLAAWGFRTMGIVAAQLLVIALWLWPKWRPSQAIPSYSESQPSSMPAAAVSVLHGHMVGTPTMLASIIEMCQRGTLRIEAVRTRAGFLYRLTRQGPTQYEWERTICNSLPPRPTTVDALDKAIDRREDDVGDQIGDYLQQRGLFHDNPVRVRKQNTDDGGNWWMAACILTAVASGFWVSLWLDQWWVNALIGAAAGLVYSFFTVPSIRTGMIQPTQQGTQEIGRWLGWEEAMAEGASPDAGEHDDSRLPYAVAFDVAQPWLDVWALAPAWFVSGEDSSLREADLDAAYRAFLHAPEWWLTGRSEDAAKAAAQHGYQEEIRLLEELGQLDMESSDAGRSGRIETADQDHDIAREPEARSSSPAVPEARYQTYRSEGMVEEEEEEEGGGCLAGCGCLLWVVAGIVGIGVAILVVLFSLDVISPRDKPCPLESLWIPTPGQIATAGDLFRDECVRVSGTVVFQDADELVLEMVRGEIVQQVSVRVPTDLFEAISPGTEMTLAGRLEVEEDGTYAVRFIPDYGADRGWWRNLQENLDGLF